MTPPLLVRWHKPAATLDHDDDGSADDNYNTSGTTHARGTAPAVVLVVSCSVQVRYVEEQAIRGMHVEGHTHTHTHTRDFSAPPGAFSLSRAGAAAGHSDLGAV